MIDFKIYGFYHVACFNRWRDIYEEQCDTIIKSKILNEISKLYTITVGEDFDKVAPIDNNIVIKYSKNRKFYEYPTLRFLYSFCLNHLKDDDLVFYIHTKGVQWQQNSRSDRWRRIMMECCILNWKKRIFNLTVENRDHFGPLYNSTPLPHYAGNFWWAKASFIKKLKEPIITDDRFYYENWLLNS